MFARIGCLVGLLLMIAGGAADAAICTANVSGTPLTCPPPPARGSRQVRRDRYGVPHITADSFYDLNFQIGVEDARDRLVQLEFFRRASKGTLAEVFGTTQIDADKDARLNLYTEEERQYFFSTMPCQTQLALQAYADGINYYVAQIYRGKRDRIPHEFYNIGELVLLSTALGLPANINYSLVQIRGETVFKPGPWVVTDSVAVAEMLVSQFGGGGGQQFRHLAMINYLTQLLTRRGDSNPAAKANEIFNDVRWLLDPKAPTSVPNSGAVGPVMTETGPLSIPDPPVCDLYTGGGGGAAAAIDPGLLKRVPPASALRAWTDIQRMQDRLAQRAKEFAVPRLHGSNGWVVTPSRSTTGNALLWGGPQEGFDNPNIDNEVYGRTPDLVGGGMKIPGAPAALIGMTDRFAFTTTSGEMDTSTIYLEQLDPARAPSDPQTAASDYYFQFNGTFQKMDRRVEVIHFAGEDPTKAAAYGTVRKAPVALNVFRVNDCDPQHFHGPVISWDLTDPQHPRAYSSKVSYWKNEQSTLEGFAEFNTAKTFQDFEAAVAKVVSLHNFFYADRLGNIAYWSAGAKPTFPASFDNRFPSLGDGSAEWIQNQDGTMYTPFSHLLYSVNPQQGYVVNWNTKPADQPCAVEGNSHDEHWGQIYRSERIGFLLANSHNLNLDDMRLIAKDIGTIDNSDDDIAPGASYFIPRIAQAYSNLQAQSSSLVDPTQHPLLGVAVDTLQTWNSYLADTSKIYPGGGHYSPTYSPFIGQPGMSVLFQWWYAFKHNLLGGGFGASSPFIGTINFSDHSIDGNDYLDEPTISMAVHLLDGALAGIPQQYEGDYFGGHADEIIIESLNYAIDLLRGTGVLPRLSFGNCDGSNTDVLGFGTNDMSQWGWPERLNLDFDCLGSLTSTMFAAGTAPTHFGRAARHNRSTYMQFVEMSQPPQGFNIIAPGESAFIRHSPPGSTRGPVGYVGGHVGDQAQLFRDFQYKPMVLP